MTRNRNLSFAVSGKASGIYRASVTAVSSDTVSVKIPVLSGSTVYADVPFYGAKPSVNDEIIVGFLQGDPRTPVAITNTASGAATSVPLGDITGVTAGLGLSGGGTGGTVSLAFAPSELSSVTVATDDKVVIADTSDSDNPKHVTVSSIAALATASPAGSDHQVQWNNSDSFGADANFTYDGSTVSISGDLTVDSGAFFVDASENSVGINTASPQVALHVSSTGTEAVRIQRSPTDQVGSYIGMYDDDERLGYIGYAGNDDLYLENEATAGNTYLSTGGAIRLAIDTNGKVGIGTTTPVAAIDLVASVGDLFTTSNWRKAVGINTGNLLYWRTANSTDWGIGATGGNMYFTTSTASDNSAAAEYRMVIEGDTGSVGIGTTAPVGNLTVKSQNREISIIDSGTVNYPEIRAHAASNATSYANINYNAYSHNFVIEGTRKLYIDNNGDILPDTDSTIDLGSSSRYFEQAYIDELYISNEIVAGDGSSGDPSYCFASDNSAGMYLVSSGTLGWSIASGEMRLNSTSLHPNSNEGLSLGKSGSVWNHFWLGQASTFSSGGYYTLRSRDDDRQVMELTSSERFKKDIVDLPLSEAYKILDARPIKYRGIDDDSSVPLEVGLSAESLHNAGYEYAVRYDEGHWGTTPRSIYYEYLTAPLIAIIKDMKTRLEALES